MSYRGRGEGTLFWDKKQSQMGVVEKHCGGIVGTHWRKGREAARSQRGDCHRSPERDEACLGGCTVFPNLCPPICGHGSEESTDPSEGM